MMWGKVTTFGVLCVPRIQIALVQKKTYNSHFVDEYDVAIDCARAAGIRCSA